MVRPSYFTTTEANLLLAKADLTAQSASGGKDNKGLGEAAREMCLMLARDEPDPKRQEMYYNAVCCPKFVRNMLHGKDLVIASECSIRKVSDMSEKRARAKDPVHTALMFDKVEALYADHYARGILKTPEPDSHQVNNCSHSRNELIVCLVADICRR